MTVKVTLLREHWPGFIASTILVQARVGSSVSTTVTRNEALRPSVFVQVTVVGPNGKNEPLAGVQMIGAQSPVVDGGAKFTIAPHWPKSLLVVIFGAETRKQVLVTLTVTTAGPEMLVLFRAW